jgi:hypothetical protein
MRGTALDDGFFLPMPSLHGILDATRASANGPEVPNRYLER